RWSVTELVLGKFRFESDDEGRHLLVRDAGEIEGWDPKLQPYVETARLAEEFLRFVRAESRGHLTPAAYFVPDASPVAAPVTHGLQPKPAIAPYSATSYTLNIASGEGSRWNVFPSAGHRHMDTTQEPRAQGGGTAAITD